jgi:hypothetical protein
MNSSDKAQIIKLYESLDFKSDYDDNYNPNQEQLKTDANAKCHNIERLISGTITYYKREKAKFFSNPNDMNSYEAIINLEKALRPLLAQFREFRD